MNRPLFHLLLLAAALAGAFACGGQSDSYGPTTDGDADAADAREEEGTDAESDAPAETETDGESAEPEDLFLPEHQTPLFEKGLILPPNSLPCVPVTTQTPQYACNHHGSSIVELADGTVASVWYHGEYEKSPDSRIVWSKLPPGAEEWTWPEVLFDDPDYSDGNPAAWVSEEGSLVVVWATLYGGTWDSTKPRLIRSDDGGATFGDPVLLRDAYCWNPRHHPLRMPNGDLLLPMYQECLALPTFIRFTPDLSRWSEQEPSGRQIIQQISQIQPTLSRLPDDTVVVMTRDGSQNHRIGRMESRDSGRTWSELERIGLPNSGTSIDQIALKDGRVVVVFNNDPFRRFPLSAALSRDGGKSFVAIRTLNGECEGSDCSYHYPSMMQSRKDGTIWISYTHNRETIGWVHFNEAWLEQGGETARLACAPFHLCVEGVCRRSCERDAQCDEENAETCAQSLCLRTCDDHRPCPEGFACSNGSCAPLFDETRVDQACADDGESDG